MNQELIFLFLLNIPIVVISFYNYYILKEKWPKIIWFLIFINLFISFVSICFLTFMSLKPVFSLNSYWSQDEIISGTKIITIWNILYIFFLLLLNKKKLNIEKLVSSFSNHVGLSVIAVYSLFAFIINLFRPGSMLQVSNILEFSSSSLSGQIFFDLPSRLYQFAFFFISIYAIKKKNKIILYISPIIFITSSVLFFVKGYRGKLFTDFLLLLLLLKISEMNRKYVIIILISVSLFGLFSFGNVAEMRFSQEYAITNIFYKLSYNFNNTINIIKEPNLIANNLLYIILRFSPADPGIFSHWVETNKAYAGWKPVIGSFFGFVPRFIWPTKPVPGALNEDISNSPPYMTAQLKLMRGSLGSHPATNSYWFFGYPAVLLASFISALFTIAIIRIGSKDYLFGSLLTVASFSYGLFNFDLDSFILFLTQTLIPIFFFLYLLNLLKIKNVKL